MSAPMKGPNACDTTSCADAAVFVVPWPGQDKKMCAPCAVRAHNIGAAMGFSVLLSPFTPVPPAEEPE